jgi:hypothetical protein
VTDERLAAPVEVDEGKETMFDVIPLTGAGRKVADADRQAQLKGEALQFETDSI